MRGESMAEEARCPYKAHRLPASGAHPHRKALRLHGSIARDLGSAHRVRPLSAGHVLDGEVEASEQRKVSRTAYREAVRILAAKGLVHSRPRVGTRVSALEEWHLLDPDVLSWVFPASPSRKSCMGFRIAHDRRARGRGAGGRRAATSNISTGCAAALDAMAPAHAERQAGRIADKEFHCGVAARDRAILSSCH